MKISEMTAANYVGKTFQALPKMEDLETEVDSGMKFVVQSINPLGYDGLQNNPRWLSVCRSQ